MNSTEFWTMYETNYLKYESPSFRLLSHPLGGDHGAFEMAFYTDNKGNWYVEQTAERRNTPFQKVFHSEEEAIDYLLRQMKLYMKMP